MTQLNISNSPTAQRSFAWLITLAAAALLAAWAYGSADAKRVGVIMISTLVSEDLTCIATGQFIARGDIGAAVGVGGCLVGIFFGDLGLWLVGRLVVRRIIHWKWATRCIDRSRSAIDCRHQDLARLPQRRELCRREKAGNRFCREFRCRRR